MKYLLILLLVFAGCRSEKWATKKVALIDMKQPAVLLKHCADKWKGGNDTTRITEYIKGEEIVRHDTIQAECPPGVDGKPVYIKVPVPVYKYRTDTVRDVRTYTVENKARVEQLTGENQNLRQDNAVLSEDNKRQKNRFLWSVIGNVVLFLGCCVLGVSLFKR